MDQAAALLRYWTEDVGPQGWYAGGEALDNEVRARWAGVWEVARAGGLTHWLHGAETCLAYLILTDQVPRNAFRGRAEAFATDGLALTAARLALRKGWDSAVEGDIRQFFYMPFEHSEDPADQAQAVRLFESRFAHSPDLALHARAHAEVIRMFGRFPTRNAALGRVSTAEETAFLAEGGYGAVVRKLTDSHARGA